MSKVVRGVENIQKYLDENDGHIGEGVTLIGDHPAVTISKKTREEVADTKLRSRQLRERTEVLALGYKKNLLAFVEDNKDIKLQPFQKKFLRKLRKRK